MRSCRFIIFKRGGSKTVPRRLTLIPSWSSLVAGGVRLYSSSLAGDRLLGRPKTR